MLHEEINTEGILRHIFTNNKSCFIPQYIGPKMEMLKLHSMEDYQSLPVTKWNIKQPAADEQREEALSSGYKSNKTSHCNCSVLIIRTKKQL